MLSAIKQVGRSGGRCETIQWHVCQDIAQILFLRLHTNLFQRNSICIVKSRLLHRCPSTILTRSGKLSFMKTSLTSSSQSSRTMNRSHEIFVVTTLGMNKSFYMFCESLVFVEYLFIQSINMGGLGRYRDSVIPRKIIL